MSKKATQEAFMKSLELQDQVNKCTLYVITELARRLAVAENQLRTILGPVN